MHINLNRCFLKRYTYLKKILFSSIIVIILLHFLLYSKHSIKSYDFIKKGDIQMQLHDEISVNLSCNVNNECDYWDMIQDDSTLSIRLVDGDLVEGHKIKEGGEYSPQECKPKYSSAIIVPYRERPEQLRSFLVYMHMFLHRQKIHYRIYVVEQVDSRPFNRAKLLNIGAVTAMKAGYPCLILHDVDLLPLKPANLYACTKCPRHMSSYTNKYRFLLPYLNSAGGAVALTSKQYKAINGMSNQYFGWGGEDDDLYIRLEANDLKMCQFAPETNQYFMKPHKLPGVKEERRHSLLSSAKTRIATDGLNSLKYTDVATVLHPLFTHIMVDL